MQATQRVEAPHQKPEGEWVAPWADQMSTIGTKHLELPGRPNASHGLMITYSILTMHASNIRWCVDSWATTSHARCVALGSLRGGTTHYVESCTPHRRRSNNKVIDVKTAGPDVTIVLSSITCPRLGKGKSPRPNKMCRRSTITGAHTITVRNSLRWYDASQHPPSSART